MRRLRGAGRPARRRRRRAPSGPRSTPAWCRPPRSTARRSSPPRGSARPDAPAPGAARDGRAAAARSAATARPASSAAWPPSTTGPTRDRDRPADERPRRHADARARPERLRPARAERQPVPLHRLPADPGRRLRARRAATPTTRFAARLRRARRRPPRRPGSAADGPTFVRPGRPGRGARPAGRATPTPQLVAGSTDWGVEVNIPARPGRR